MSETLAARGKGMQDDRLLVLLLAALLWQNGASKELILALMYIAL